MLMQAFLIAAMGFRPRPRAENVESTLIWYKNGDSTDIQHWVNELNQFITDYEKEKREEEENGTPRDTRACKFQDTWLKGYCNKAESWGYNRDSPCILLKLNKMIDWEPEVYKTMEELPEDMPQSLKDTISNATLTNNNKMPPMVWVSCEGENPADKEYLPKVELSPNPGFPAYYFPYTKVPGYRSPLVGVMIYNPEPNVLINIECRLWAKNIVPDRGNRLGMVHFELLKD
ncbi:UNVERIFIED_CONTAM: hypothetical protein GTU68_041488 [Idotea baltica]|nr:hypothetical protein [Idotea baltica]